MTARAEATIADVEKLFDLLQMQFDPLSALDEAQPLDLALVVDPVPTGRPSRRRKEPLPSRSSGLCQP